MSEEGVWLTTWLRTNSAEITTPTAKVQTHHNFTLSSIGHLEVSGTLVMVSFFIRLFKAASFHSVLQNSFCHTLSYFPCHVCVHLISTETAFVPLFIFYVDTVKVLLTWPTTDRPEDDVQTYWSLSVIISYPFWYVLVDSFWACCVKTKIFVKLCSFIVAKWPTALEGSFAHARSPVHSGSTVRAAAEPDA